MPWGRYPERVKPFRKWATDKVDNSKLSDSATPHKNRSFRRRRKKSQRKVQD